MILSSFDDDVTLARTLIQGRRRRQGFRHGRSGGPAEAGLPASTSYARAPKELALSATRFGAQTAFVEPPRAAFGSTQRPPTPVPEALLSTAQVGVVGENGLLMFGCGRMALSLAWVR